MYYYGTIDNMNLLLAHVDAMKGEQKERDNLKGQAYAFRAHSYFKLVRCMRSVINRKAVTPNWESPYIRIRPVRGKPAVRWRCLYSH